MDKTDFLINMVCIHMWRVIKCYVVLSTEVRKHVAMAMAIHIYIDYE